ncbi:MAG: 3-dehydroquinate synthase II [Promethearchaeia archaeon]
MKKIILDFASKMSEFKELVQEAFNKDILHFLVSKDTIDEFKDIERITLYAKGKALDSDYTIIEDMSALERQLENSELKKNIAYFKRLKSKEDEVEIVENATKYPIDMMIVSAEDWKIIPFENLIAKMHKNDTELIAQVQDIEEAELMLKTLEMGVDGVLIEPKSANDLVDLKNLTVSQFSVPLTTAKVVNVTSIPESDRVCVDTTSLLRPGEGMLVGSTAMGFALVHAEVFETQFVASRPFRVNAGDVSAYILVPGEEPGSYKTNYLSELKGGDKVIVVDTDSNARIVSVGRVKIETRPMLRFELEATQDGKKIPINCICQNAETIRLVSSNGEAKSVVDIEEGDKILVHIGPGATHFGTAIKETIIEK